MSEIDNSGVSNGQLNRVNILVMLSVVANLLLTIALSIFGYLMYPFFILYYIWIAIYALFIATLIRRESIAKHPLIINQVHLGVVVALTILIRLIFVGMTHHISLDALWYVDYGKFMHMDVLPYTGFYFPYPPVFSYFIFIITSFFQGVEGFRLFAILMDAAVVIVLWKLVNQELGTKWASTAVLAYAFLPISVIESGWNGHFEPLVNLLLLLSLWFITQKKYCISGVFLGLAIATKVYPIVVFPILFVYIMGGKNRLRFALSAVCSSVLTFVPILLAGWIANPSSASSTSQSIPLSDLFESLFGFLFTLPFPADLITIGLIITIMLGVIHVMRTINRNDPLPNARIYRFETVIVGLILIAMGVIAGLYPLLPISRQVYWRFPVDVGLVRGITTICIGLLIIFIVYRERESIFKKQISRNSLLALIGATTLLLIAIARLFFYGWYLLWSIPFFLILRDRRLGYLVLLCLLLVYPNYTHDNFASLGFEETRQWQDEFEEANGWTPYINIRGEYTNESQVSAYVAADGTNGRFWFDTRNVANDSYLSDISISYTKEVHFGFDETTEFVARIASSWDPPFGRYADLSFSFEGIDGNNESISGSIIPKTSDFTNLTYILWRYAFMNVGSLTQDGIVTHLNLTVYPVQRVLSSYQVDFLYTTYAGPLNPVYFLIVPSLIAITLTAFTILFLQLEKEHNRH